MLSHRALYLHAIHNALTNGISGDDVLLHTIPLFHVNGWGTPHFLTGLGGTHVMLPRFDPGEVLRLVERERVTRLFLVPTMARLLLDHPDVRTRDLAGAAGVDRGRTIDTRAPGRGRGRVRVRGHLRLRHDRVAPTLTRSLAKPGTTGSRAQRATTGLPILGVDLRVLDHDDARCRGTAWRSERSALGPTTYDRVLGPRGGDREALRGGWLRTGDLAVVDADGYVTIVDRRKDLIVSGGENIASVEVEAGPRPHPAVREAAVVGMADHRWGEVPAAFVSLRPDASATEAELIAWVHERLARFKAPKRVTILDELPKGGTGKVSKPALRELLSRHGQQDVRVEDPGGVEGAP